MGLGLCVGAATDVLIGTGLGVLPGVGLVVFVREDSVGDYLTCLSARNMTCCSTWILLSWLMWVYILVGVGVSVMITARRGKCIGTRPNVLISVGLGVLVVVGLCSCQLRRGVGTGMTNKLQEM